MNQQIMKIVLSYLTGAVTSSLWWVGVLGTPKEPMFGFAIAAAIILTILAVCFVINEALNEK